MVSLRNICINILHKGDNDDDDDDDDNNFVYAHRLKYIKKIDNHDITTTNNTKCVHHLHSFTGPLIKAKYALFTTCFL